MEKEIKQIKFADEIQFLAIFSGFSKLDSKKAEEIVSELEFPECPENTERREKYFIRDDKLALQAIYEYYDGKNDVYSYTSKECKKNFEGLVQMFEDVLSAFD